jgi:hypothetical protein
MLSSDTFKSSIENFNINKLDVLDKIYHILENAFYFKSIDVDDDFIFVSKVVLKLIKNQNTFLFIVME